MRLPGSKSISNRVLLLAGLSAGTTTIHGLLESDDTQVMLSALQLLGCGIEANGATTLVAGLGGRLRVRDAKLFLGNAGTAMRPLTAALAVLAATHGAVFELRGVARMHERPIGDLVDALRRLGCGIDYLGQPGFPPLRLRAGRLPLRLDASIPVRGDVSSQFLTALLMALPLAAATAPVVIEVEGELISRPYAEMTLHLLDRFGIAVERDGWRRFTIARGSAYRTPGEIDIEGDASSASYFIALGAIAAVGQPLRIEGLDGDSIQGDVRFVDAARAMGAEITAGDGFLDVRRGSFPLRAITLDCNHIPDAAMTLAVMALYADGTTRLDNIASWRVKETDRIAAMSTELRKLGASVVEGADFIKIDPPSTWRAAVLDTYDDHRMAMCLSLVAFNALAGAQPPVPVRILDPRCVGKTFPEYFETFFRLVSAKPADIPVIAIDGPTASGKGTVASAVARALGYNYLDSGAVYRAAALAALRAGIDACDEAALVALAERLPLHFAFGKVFLNDDDVTDQLRLEHVGAMASTISTWPAVRLALRQLQLAFHRVPGLVADGRDMGTVVFPAAELKVFLNAGADTRALRRQRQLISMGIPANIDSLRADLEARDARDQFRSVSPLKPAASAVLLDNSTLSIEASVDSVLEVWQQRRPFG